MRGRQGAIVSDPKRVRTPEIRVLVSAGVLLCFVVVVLGAYVRLTAAGLGCPDWPGCYGRVTPVAAAASPEAQAAFPDKPLDVGKAWHEMIHRYAAGTLGLVILGIAVLTFVTEEGRCLIGTGYGLGLAATVVFQAVLGMLTVTWQLKPLIVTLHLIFGLATLSLLWWLWLSLDRRGAVAAQGPHRQEVIHTAFWLIGAGLGALILQIALGGWTSSNYAAVACPDFPTCQNAWLPHADFRNAFVLWRGLGINYEGGVLAHPARVAIHFTHRLGALVASLALLAGSAYVIARVPSPPLRLRAGLVLVALGLQLVIAITMVEQSFPLSVATAHNAGAALLLLATLALFQGVAAARQPVHPR
jgi:cytochrome c oxidase assembly protein subunit 15